MTLRVAIGHGSLAVAANLQPNQPTLTGGTIGETNWSLSSSAFSDPDTGDTHLNSDWQVTLATDTTFASPVWESLASTTSKTSASATGLTGSTSYIARVRYRDNHGAVSEYSSTVADTTEASGGVSPLFEDGFETYADYAVITGEGANGFVWGQQNHGSPNSVNPRTGSKSYAFRYNKSGEAQPEWSEVYFDLGANYTEVWMEYYLHIQSDFEHPAGAGWFKYFFIYGSNGYPGNPGTPDHIVFISALPSTSPHLEYCSTYYSDGDQVIHHVENDWLHEDDLDTWVKLQIHLKASGNAVDTDALIEVYKNGAKIIDINTFNYYHATDNGWRGGYLMGWHDGADLHTGQVDYYLDDFKVYTSDPGW